MSAAAYRIWRAFFRWLPITAKCLLWFGIACGAEFLTRSEKLGSADVAPWGWLEWLKFWTAILLPGFITVRTFFDQSVSRHIETLLDKDSLVGETK